MRKKVVLWTKPRHAIRTLLDLKIYISCFASFCVFWRIDGISPKNRKQLLRICKNIGMSTQYVGIFSNVKFCYQMLCINRDFFELRTTTNFIATGKQKFKKNCGYPPIYEIENRYILKLSTHVWQYYTFPPRETIKGSSDLGWPLSRPEFKVVMDRKGS